MAYNAANVCDIKSDQTIKGKKTFIKEVVAPAFVLEEETKITKTKDGAVSVNGRLRADKFEGDASGLKNFSVKNMNTDDIQASLAINGLDYLLVQKILDGEGELKKFKINDLLTLIPSKNGVHYSFINNAENKGAGCQIFKRRHSAGRSQLLYFRTLTSGSNIELLQNENEIDINLKDKVSISEVNVAESFMVPCKNKDAISAPTSGMIVYDNAKQRFYGYAKDRWVPLHGV